MLLLLTPHEHSHLLADYLRDYLTTNPLPTEIDLIEAITGYPNLTHDWNAYGLKTELVQEASRQASAIQSEVA
jgi:hypothetical protein